MKILTVRQPWAWLILNGKDIENRTWASSYRGPILIQSSAKKASDHEQACRYAAARGVRVPEELQYGGIVGAAVLNRCCSSHSSPWFMGPVGWVLEHAQALPFTPINGRLGLFDAPEWLLDQLRPHLSASLVKAQHQFDL